MKELLEKVVEPEKAAQANVIRRREETNETRSVLNIAKAMESNTVALRLKELETPEKITERIGNISVGHAAPLTQPFPGSNPGQLPSVLPRR